MQITAGALTGRFGRRVKYWGERFVGEGHCMMLATDAHHPQRRPPLLAEAREAAALLVGREAAEHMVLTRPRRGCQTLDPAALPPRVALVAAALSALAVQPRSIRRHSARFLAGYAGAA